MVLPAIESDLVCYYDFDHPAPGDANREQDQGLSGTSLFLVNGGARMRVDDAAYPGAGHSLQTRQQNPHEYGNDDWKAGTYDADGVATLDAFRAAAGMTLMGWIKPTGGNPGLNSTTPGPDDTYSAVGLRRGRSQQVRELVAPADCPRGLARGARRAHQAGRLRRNGLAPAGARTAGDLENRRQSGLLRGMPKFSAVDMSGQDDPVRARNQKQWTRQPAAVPIGRRTINLSTALAG